MIGMAYPRNRFLGDEQNALGSLLEVRGFGLVDSYKLLRVAVDQRKPRALDLHHDAVTAAERHEDVGKATLSGLPGSKGTGFSKLLRNFRELPHGENAFGHHGRLVAGRNSRAVIHLRDQF